MLPRLLGARGPWTVVAMSEIMRNSFTVMEPVEAETHRFRTWKNHGGGQPIQFLCVLRGDEARVTEEVDNTTFTRNANPWKHVDRREARMRDALRDRELEKRNPGVFAPLLPPVGSHPLYPTQWAMGSHPSPSPSPSGSLHCPPWPLRRQHQLPCLAAPIARGLTALWSAPL